MAKKLPIKEFIDFGYLQEVNRQFFHPLGLALEYAETKLGPGLPPSYKLDIQDHRDDRQGVIFGPNVMSREKFERIEREWYECAGPRIDLLHYMVQPPPPGKEKPLEIEVQSSEPEPPEGPGPEDLPG